MRSPVASARIPRSGSSSFGYRRSPTHVHQGLDFFAPIGTPIEATAAGVVTHASAELERGFSGYGRHVVIETDSGVWQLHAHLDEVQVAPGQRVKAGERLGTVGDTCFRLPGDGELLADTAAERCQEPQLHFEVSPAPYPQESEARRLDAAAWLDVQPGQPSTVDAPTVPKRRQTQRTPKGAPAAGPPFELAPFWSFWQVSRRSLSSWDYR